MACADLLLNGPSKPHMQNDSSLSDSVSVSHSRSARVLLVQASVELALLLSLRLISQVATGRWEVFGGFVTDACTMANGDEIHSVFSTVDFPIAAANDML